MNCVYLVVVYLTLPVVLAYSSCVVFDMCVVCVCVELRVRACVVEFVCVCLRL